MGCAEAESREEAVSLGQLLVNTDYIHHVMDEHHFEDDFLFFRFRQDGERERKRERERERGREGMREGREGGKEEVGRGGEMCF